MKNRITVFAVLLAASAARAQMPAFEKGVKVQAGGKDIEIAVGHCVPAAADWNGDGKKDLIVGHFAGKPGNIKLFLNKGTDAKPVLAAGVDMTAGGAPIRMDGG